MKPTKHFSEQVQGDSWLEKVRNSFVLCNVTSKCKKMRKMSKVPNDLLASELGIQAGDNGRFYMDLLPRCRDFQALKAVTAKFRNYSYSVTEEYHKGAFRILPINKHAEYAARLHEAQNEAQHLSLQIVRNWEEHLEESRRFWTGINGTLFNASDYPTPDKFMRGTVVSTDFELIPDYSYGVMGQFAELGDQLRKDVEAKLQNKLSASFAEAIDSLTKELADFAHKLDSVGMHADGRQNAFRNGKLDKLSSIIDSFKSWDIEGKATPSLERLQKVMSETTADKLRSSHRARTTVKTEIEATVSALEISKPTPKVETAEDILEGLDEMSPF